MTEEEVKQQLKDTDELRTTEQYESLKLYRQLDNQEEFKKTLQKFFTSSSYFRSKLFDKKCY